MRLLIVLLLCLSAAPSWAANWSGIVAPARATDWSTAGAGTTMVTRTTVCSSLTSTATAAIINAAIQACPAGQVVSLAAGTYTIGSPGITFAGKSNVTLRGAGANSTFLNFTGSNTCGGTGTAGAICVSPASPQFIVGADGQNAAWTAGYAQGSSTITISTKAGLAVGAMMVIGQARDASDTGNVYVCTNATCSNGSGSESFGSGRGQGSIVFVTSIPGTACPCAIGITPALRMPNWRSGQSPNVQYETNTHISGVGIENLSVNYDGVQVIHGISFYQASHSWIKGVRSVNPGVSGSAAKHVRLVAASQITIRDSYFWGGKDHTAESYGIAPLGVSNLLVENNIFQYITSPIVNEGNEGSVFAYNYSIDDLFSDGTWAQASWYHHSNSNNYLLWESNDGFGLTADIHAGGAFFITAFRNRALGKEGVNSSQTVPIHLYGFNRYENIIGNVLGDNAYHTTYQTRAGLESEANCNFSIYALGWGGNCGAGGPNNDSLVNTTLMRWGNYDTVNDATRFVSAEVPSGLSLYANPVPATQSLPATFYLDGKPQFYFLNNVPWPSIGPDVTGGSEPNVGGHNAKIPARRCFENLGGAFGQRTTALPFNAQSCYGTMDVYQAASCNGSSDHLKVQTLVTLAQNTDTILIPAGSCTFGSAVTWLNKALVIRGAGVGVTNINSGSGAAFDINVTTYAGWRLTGMTITSNNNSGGIINIAGNSMTGQISSRFRIDHVTINATGGTPRHVHVHGPAYGVIDHATINFTGPGTANGIGVESSMSASDTTYGGLLVVGSYACNNFPLDLGGDTAVYVEDSTFNNILNNNSSGVNDLAYCARMVFRYNTVTGPWHMQTHSTRGMGSYGERGGIKSEYYNNWFDGGNNVDHPGPAVLRSGAGMFFNNRLTGQACWWCTGGQVLWIDAQRHPNTSCTVNGAPFGVASGSNPVDGRIESNGWPALDQPGWAGPMAAQTNYPLYVWNNGSGAGCNTGGTCTGLTNVVFIRCEGEGTAGSRPEDYMKTTPHSNGMKDYCVGTTTMPGSCGTHTNTYVPYAYPHPLTGGAVAAALGDTTPPAAPTGVTITRLER